MSWLANSLTCPRWAICICSGFLSICFATFFFSFKKKLFLQGLHYFLIIHTPSICLVKYKTQQSSSLSHLFWILCELNAHTPSLRLNCGGSSPHALLPGIRPPHSDGVPPTSPTWEPQAYHSAAVQTSPPLLPFLLPPERLPSLFLPLSLSLYLLPPLLSVCPPAMASYFLLTHLSPSPLSFPAIASHRRGPSVASCRLPFAPPEFKTSCPQCTPAPPPCRWGLWLSRLSADNFPSSPQPA